VSWRWIGEHRTLAQNELFATWTGACKAVNRWHRYCGAVEDVAGEGVESIIEVGDESIIEVDEPVLVGAVPVLDEGVGVVTFGVFLELAHAPTDRQQTTSATTAKEFLNITISMGLSGTVEYPHRRGVKPMPVPGGNSRQRK
jgi:hypothetical protein